MKQLQKVLKNFTCTILFFFFFVPSVYASAFLDPLEIDYSNWPDSYYTSIKSYGTFFGVNDIQNGFELHDDITAENLFRIFGGLDSVGYGMSTMLNQDTISSDIGANIRNAAWNLTNNYPNAENYFLYIGGHGGYDPDYRWHDSYIPDTDDPYAILINRDEGFDTLTALELKDYLSAIPSNINKWIFLDACHSGGFIPFLEELENISILTSASSTSVAYANSETGITFFGKELENFLTKENENGFSFDDIVNYMTSSESYSQYLGMTASETGFGDQVILTEEHFNVQSYQSPSYYNQPVPEPTTMLLLGTGLVSLAGFRRKLKKA